MAEQMQIDIDHKKINQSGNTTTITKAKLTEEEQRRKLLEKYASK